MTHKYLGNFQKTIELNEQALALVLLKKLETKIQKEGRISMLAVPIILWAI